MRTLWSLVVASCLAPLFGCEDAEHDGGALAGDLVVLAASEQAGLEVRYAESGRAIVLRSRPLGNGLETQILDGDQSIGARAREVVARGTGVRTADGAPLVPIRQRFEDAQSFSAALKLTRHALRQLHEVLPKQVLDGPHLAALDKEVAPVREALTKTRLVLLAEWASEARRRMQLTPDEHARFFDVFNRRARQMAARQAAAQAGKRARHRSAGGGATTLASRADEEIAALLGPERYQKYLALRSSWIAGNGGDEGGERLP